MSTPTFEIRFPAYTSGDAPRCGPKSTLAGVVYLHTTRPVRASCLSLGLIGSERISLAPASVNTTTTWSQGVAVPEGKQRSVKKVYFNQSTVLWGDGKLRETGSLPPGVHMFHFSCEFPRVNYPESRSTSEYEIRYALKARLLNPRDARECTQMAVSQDITYVPETVAPLLPEPTVVDGDHNSLARYVFCDNAGDGSQWAYHLRASRLQQAFRPGDAIDLQLRITGNRTLRRIRVSAVEQTDCFYPQIPEPHEEQLDMGRRLWSSQRVLSDPVDLPFERDSCVLPDLCTDHMNSRRTRGGSTYYAHLHMQLPKDVRVLNETGYLRYTYFVRVSLVSGSAAAWGTSHTRCAEVRIPVPIATRVLPEDATPQPLSAQRRRSAATGGNGFGRKRGPSTSSSVRTEVNSVDVSECSAGEFDEDPGPLRHGRSIADLGARLQQFIPRRLPSAHFSSALHIRHQQPPTPRAVSHGRMTDHQPLWTMVDMPPMPTPAGIGAIPAAHESQGSLFSSPLARTASVCIPDGNPDLPTTGATAPTNPQLAKHPTAGTAQLQMANAGGRFSLTFLLKLREFYHDEANGTALMSVIGGFDGGSNSIIPSAVRRGVPSQTPEYPPPMPRLGIPSRRGDMRRSRDISLNSSIYSSGGKRSNRLSVQSLASMVSVNERVRPQLEAVMTSFRDPVTSQVVTWSALSPSSGRPPSMHYPTKDTVSSKDSSGGSQPRYSRLSAMSVSSNDTACNSNGCLSLPKDVLPTVPSSPVFPHV
ncbi:hypothetical protein GGF46_003741 [Coemansia sp. RSA 552]|nr:hypothetical protein GGF46_003741 [Coemansia sp. RSA 552]